MSTQTVTFGTACSFALTHELRAFLDLLVGDEAPDAYLDVRTREPGDVMKQNFVDIATRADLLEALPAAAARADVYVG
jgi:hypothetical protein